MKLKKMMIAVLICTVLSTFARADTTEIVSQPEEIHNEEGKTEDSAEEKNDIDEASVEPDNESDKMETETEELPENELLYSESSVLSDGLEYTRNLYYHPSYGNQREYILEYTPSDITSLHFSGNEYLYKTSIIKDIAAYNHPEENFVAGINCDFFNMSTGVPDSAYIKGYELYTTDRDNFCLALTDTGEYFFDKPSVKIELVSEDENVINIAHLNKEFSEYALYLYNSNYSPTTHIKKSYSEAVLVPYDDVMNVEELLQLYDDDESALYDEYKNAETDDEKAVFYEMLAEKSGYTYIGGMFYHIVGVFPSIGYSEKLVVTEVNKDCKNSEIPNNSYLLCGDSSSYGYIVDTMKPGDTFELKISGNESYENVIDAIGVGVMIVNNSEIIDNTSHSIYTSLQPRSAVGIKEDGTLVFYATDGRQKNKSAGIKLIDLANIMKSLGCTYAANLDGGGSTAVNAARPGIDLAETVNFPSGKSERSISNAFIFTNKLEKAETAYSAHYYTDSIITFSDWMIELPVPVIADENGFKFEDDEETKTEINYYINNEDSLIHEGNLYINGVNGVIDVFADVNGITHDTPVFSVYTVDEPDEIELSADITELAPFETAQLKADAYYKNLPVISGNQSYVWSVKASDEDFATGKFGSVENGEFFPIRKGEEYTITATKGNTSDSIKIYVDSYPFEDIENHWAVKDIYKLAKDGVVKGYPDEETGDFFYLPQRSYSRYEFIVMLARMTGIGSDIEVPQRIDDENSTDEELNNDAVIDDTTRTDDNNTKEIIAEEEISEENAEADFQDEEDEDDASASESDSSVVVDDETITETKEISENQSEEKTAEDGESVVSDDEDIDEEIAVIPDFYDWDIVPEWAYDSVYRLYVSGFLDEIMQTDENGNTVLNGPEYITRADVMTVLGMLCDTAPDEYQADIYSDLTEEQRANEYIRNAIYAGIFSGYEDNTLRPFGYLTRAEAANVFVRLEKFLSQAEV